MAGSETAAFEQDKAEAQATSRPAKLSAVQQLKEYPRETLTVVGLTLGGTLAFYTFTTYAQKFLVNTSS